jgi:transcriptional regulator with GAF, ATPase, and Fis domain
MSDVTIARAFAEAAARLTSANDVAGSLVALLNDCAALVRADAAGLLVQTGGEDSLDLLSSTSHQATDLELYELQTGHGPCIEAIKQNEVVSVTSPALAGLWPPVGKAFSDAGYQAVHAFPLRWQNRAIGALNVFARTADPLDRDLSEVGQGFASMAVAILGQPADIGWVTVSENLARVLAERTTIERAKGVLAVTHEIDINAAFNLLVRTAAREGVPLHTHAERILNSVHRDR